jgi:cytochrome c biogenesis protein CcmG, thiol:disulfide interchange protein DsbE
MRRFMVPGLITLVAVALLATLAYGVSSQSTNGSIDAEVARGDFPRAPEYDVALPMLDSKGRESLRDLRGKVVLVNVFASWCVPCAQEAPALEQAQRMMERQDGTVLGVTYQDIASDDAAFARKYHLTYPIVRDVGGNFVRGFGTTGVPESFVISRTGRVQALRRYQLTSQWIDGTLPKILAEKS